MIQVWMCARKLGVTHIFMEFVPHISFRSARNRGCRCLLTFIEFVSHAVIEFVTHLSCRCGWARGIGGVTADHRALRLHMARPDIAQKSEFGT